MAATLDRIRSRRSHGVILKAPDVPEIITACWQLIRAGIPIVTLVTDLPAASGWPTSEWTTALRVPPPPISWANG